MDQVLDTPDLDLVVVPSLVVGDGGEGVDDAGGHAALVRLCRMAVHHHASVHIPGTGPICNRPDHKRRQD